MKKKVALLLCTAILFTLLSACGSSSHSANDDSDTVQVSFWLPKGEDSTYYMSYEENPSLKYVEQTQTFAGKKVHANFVIPVSGKELDNFNTLLMTDEYCGIMDMSFSTTSAMEMYEDGYIWDLTPYVKQYMPNYQKIIDNNPDLASNMYSLVDGEKKLLSIFGGSEEPSINFMGFLYRRDWIAKYGTNPLTGNAFTFGYTDPDDFNSYYDDVVFPSGGKDPVYISDWEWMFEIFTRAMADLGITDGYCLSLFYKGYNEAGALNNAFGGTCPLWYKNLEGNATFGGADEKLRTYLTCMNNWYEKGWLDKNFVEHTGDAVYTVDSSKVHMGKVGLWIGRRSETGGQMDIDDKYTDGIMVYGARCPINDIYGGPEQQNQIPYCIYQKSRLSSSVVITNKVSEEDLPAVLAYIDYFYTREGSEKRNFGLTKEEFEEVQDALYIKYGLTEGSYYTETGKDGSIAYIRTPKLLTDNNLASAMSIMRFNVGWGVSGVRDGLLSGYMPCARNAMVEWDYYLNTGFPDNLLRSQFTTEESNTYSKVYANVDTFMSTTIPKFIFGVLDISSDLDWDDYCKMLHKYAPEKITGIYQRLYDSLQ